jgi:hypothetical protein
MEVWDGLGMSQVLENARNAEVNGYSILESLLLDTTAAAISPEVRRCDLAAVATWYIWWERRRATHGETLQNPTLSALSILTLTMNYGRAKKLGTPPIDRHGWKKSQEELLKLNVDAAFNVDTGSGGTGAILRDHTGSCIAAGHWTLQYVEAA